VAQLFLHEQAVGSLGVNVRVWHLVSRGGDPRRGRRPCL